MTSTFVHPARVKNCRAAAASAERHIINGTLHMYAAKNDAAATTPCKAARTRLLYAPLTLRCCNLLLPTMKGPCQRIKRALLSIFLSVIRSVLAIPTSVSFFFVFLFIHPRFFCNSAHHWAPKSSADELRCALTAACVLADLYLSPQFSSLYILVLNIPSRRVLKKKNIEVRGSATAAEFLSCPRSLSRGTPFRHAGCSKLS